MGNSSYIVRRYPDIKKYFILISTATDSRKWAAGQDEDVHGLTLEAFRDDYKEKFPDRSSMVIRNADFIDEKDFYPVEVKKEYDVFFNSALWKEKRHELFLSTLYDLKRNYQRNVKVAVILWSGWGRPRLRNSRVYSKSFYRLVRSSFLRENEVRSYARHIRRLYENAIRDGLQIDIFDPMDPSEENAVPNLRLLYNKSKMYLLLSKTEGTNRAAKEAILCNTPVLVINGSTAAREWINPLTGKAVEDTQKDVSEGILDILDHYRAYSPRSWAVKHCPRMRVCHELWEKVNELQRFPGYPGIHEANEIRRQFTSIEHDNYLDLNNWKGVASTGSLREEMRRIRERYSSYQSYQSLKQNRHE